MSCIHCNKGVHGVKYFDSKLLYHIKERRSIEAQLLLLLYENPLHLKDSTEATLLHHAATFGNEVMIEHILAIDNKILDCQDCLGRTPLMLAIIGKHEPAIKILLKANANILIVDSNGKNSLDMIFDSTPVCWNVVKMFFHERSIDSITKDITREALARKLIDAGCSLFHTVLMKSLDMARLLLDHGCSINAVVSERGKTALHLAVQMQDVEMVKLLVSYGAETDICDLSDNSPLNYTQYSEVSNTSSELEIFKFLFERIVALNTTIHQSGSAQWKSGTMNWQMGPVLQHGNERILKIVLQSGIDMQASDISGDGVLHHLVQNKRFRFQDFEKTNFDVNMGHRRGITALHIAAQGHVVATRFLLDNKADVDPKNIYQQTPLHRALYYCKDGDDTKCIKLLLQSGADVQLTVDSHFGNITIFEEFLKYRSAISLSFLEPVIVHLAITKVQGIHITEGVRLEINSRSEFQDCFDKCERSLRKMKTLRIGNTKVTLYEFLSEKNEQIGMYVRNEEIVTELTKIIENCTYDPPYLSELMETRLTEAVRRREVRDQAAHDLYKITGLCYNVVEHILDYLLFVDFNQLQKVCINLV